MKNILIILLIFFLASETYSQKNLKEFNSYLSRDQSEAFNQAVYSFRKFLELNYAEVPDLTGRSSQFLTDMGRLYEGYRPKWVLPEDIHQVLKQWEQSGLRKEVWLWPNENYFPFHALDSESDLENDSMVVVEIEEEIIPIKQRGLDIEESRVERDSTLHSNTFGRFIFALDTCCSADTLISSYVNVKRFVGDISPSLVADAYLSFGEERFKDPVIMRMIIVEFYYLLMQAEAKE